MFTQQALLRYHELAYEGLDKLHAHVAGMPAELHNRAVPGFGVDTLIKQLSHLSQTEHFSVMSATGASVEDFDFEPLDSLSALGAYRQQVRSYTRNYIMSRTAEQLNVPLAITMFGHTFSGVPAEMILHVMTHAYHHKGQAVAMCRLLGHPAPQTDMFWIEFQNM